MNIEILEVELFYIDKKEDEFSFCLIESFVL